MSISLLGGLANAWIIQKGPIGPGPSRRNRAHELTHPGGRLYFAWMKVNLGIIGGTGVGDRFAAMEGKALHVPTSHGLLKGRLAKIGSANVLFIARHSLGHKTPPNAVNYLAMAEGLKRLGAKYCLGTAAVGAVHDDLAPGSFCVCSDFIDLTGRNETLFANRVQHTDFSIPMGSKSRNALNESCAQAGLKLPEKATYVCTNGPRYETPAEISSYVTMGGDLVGMTAATEAVVMREAGIDYACLAIITNLAAGVSKTALSHAEVSKQMVESGEKAVSILLDAARRLA